MIDWWKTGPRAGPVPAKTERNAKIVASIEAGAKIRVVAAEHGISPGRVQQIVARARKRLAEKDDEA